MTREAIYAALFARVSTAADFVTATRRVKEYAEVDQATQPAILQVELGEKWAEPGTPPQPVVLRAKLFLYCESNDPTSPVATQINNLIDAVVAALAPPDIEERQTLGGLVYNAAITGEVTIAEGLSGQSEVSIPIEIILG
ncbi:MAG TPA: hypothetical protein VMU22_06550 [Rhizomicrobium sp.]|nr:hypothetical protein [Rhizomicrobium sp.]